MDAIEKCINANRHGNAIAWNQNGRVEVFKSMDKNETLAKYKELVSTLNPAETAMIFHARIATHGSHCVKNCHGWKHGELAFFHNGILHNISNRDDLTDSETFFRDFFVPAMEGCGMDFALKMSRAIIGESNNKFALVDGNGHIYMTSGNYHYVKIQFPGLNGKIYFSNDHWLPKATYGMGFDPLKTPSLTSGKKDTKPSASSSLPPVGPRRQVAPGGQSQSINSFMGSLFDGDLEKRYQALSASRAK